MVDPGFGFKSAAVQELEEECGIIIKEEEMIKLGFPMAPSPGACDETIQIFAVEKEMSEISIQQLNGRLGGLPQHGERIKTRIVKLQEMVSVSKSLVMIAAVHLYEEFKATAQ